MNDSFLERQKGSDLILSGKAGVVRSPDDAWDFSGKYALDIIFSLEASYGAGLYTLKTVGNGANGNGAQIDLVSLYDTGSFYSISASFGKNDTTGYMVSFAPSADIIANGNFATPTGGTSQNGFSTVPGSWSVSNDAASAYVTLSSTHTPSVRIYTTGAYSSTTGLNFSQTNKLIPNRVYWLSYTVAENIGINQSPLLLYVGPGKTGGTSGHSYGASYQTMSCSPGYHELTFSFESYSDLTTRSSQLQFFANGSLVDVTLEDISLREANSVSNTIVSLHPGKYYYAALSRDHSDYFDTSSGDPKEAETVFCVYEWNSNESVQEFKKRGFFTYSGFEFTSVSSARYPSQPISLGYGQKRSFSLDGSVNYQMTASGASTDSTYHFSNPCNMMYFFDKKNHFIENVAHPSTESILIAYDKSIYTDDDLWGKGSIDPRYARVTGSFGIVCENKAGQKGHILQTLGAVDGTDFNFTYGTTWTDSRAAGWSTIQGHKAFTVAAWSKIDYKQASPGNTIYDNNCILRIGDGDFTSASLATEFDASNYRIYTVSGHTQKSNAISYIRRDLPAASTAFTDAPYNAGSINKGDGATGIWFGLSKSQAAPYDNAGLLPTLYFTLYSSDTFKNAPLDATPANNDDPAWCMFRARLGGMETDNKHMTQSENEWWLTLYSVRISTSVGASLTGYSDTTPGPNGTSKEGMLEIYMFRAPASEIYGYGKSITSSTVFQMTTGDRCCSASKNQFYTMVLPEQDFWVDPIVVKSGANTRNGVAGTGTDNTALSGSNIIISTSGMWCADFTASNTTEITQSSYYTGSSFAIGSDTNGRSTFSGEISAVAFMPDTFFNHNNISTWLKQVGPGGLTPPQYFPLSIRVIESGVYGFSLHDLGESDLSRGVLEQKTKTIDVYRLDQESFALHDIHGETSIGLV